MVFFLMVLKALVAATRAVVCSWAQFPKFYTGLLSLVLVPGMALAVCLPLLHPDVLVAAIATSLIVTIVVLLLVGGLGWAIGASNAMGAISSVLIDLEDMLDEFITRLNPQYGLDLLDREQNLTDEIEWWKQEELNRFQEMDSYRDDYREAIWKQGRAEESAEKLRRVVSFVQQELAKNGEAVLANHVEAILKMEEDFYQE